MGRKAKDLTGMIFGELTAIEQIGSSPNGIVWRCSCSCGNVADVVSARLLSGKTKSCGHLKESSNKIKDSIGKRFGRLIVVDVGSKNGHCVCQCDCGNKKEVLLKSLVRGKTKSCGCLQKEIVRDLRETDLTGQRFGRWNVIGKARDGSYCKCRCDCGTIKDVDKNSLKNGDSTSCGCYKRELTSAIMTKDLSGQKFGKLLVVDRSGSCVGADDSKYATWNCICDCGNNVVVKGVDMLCGKVSSCGCLISKGEYLMRQKLLEKNIRFKTQYSFDDLRSDKGGLLKFDFAIVDDCDKLLCLIEYQGIQHDSSYAKHHISFGEQQRNITDSMKRVYCASKNIPLFEIWYNQDIETELNKILKSINYMSTLCQASKEEG